MQVKSILMTPENIDAQSYIEEWLFLPHEISEVENLDVTEKAYGSYVKDCIEAGEPPLSYVDFSGLTETVEKYLAQKEGH